MILGLELSQYIHKRQLILITLYVITFFRRGRTCTCLDPLSKSYQERDISDSQASPATFAVQPSFTFVRPYFHIRPSQSLSVSLTRAFFLRRPFVRLYPAFRSTSRLARPSTQACQCTVRESVHHPRIHASMNGPALL